MRGQDRDHAAGMGQDAGHVAARQVGEAVLVRRVGKRVTALGHRVEALVGVHARPVDAVDGLGHERGVKAVQVGDGLEGELEGDRVVGRLEPVGVLEVDLVLAGGDLVVGRLHADPERLERVDHVLAHFLGQVGREVEVAGLVVRQGRHVAVLITPEEEELELGAGVPDVAQLAGPLDLLLQHEARVAHEGVAAGGHDVADDARGAAAAKRTAAQRPVARLPGDLGERVHVRLEPLVALGDAREALDRAAVEPGAVLDRAGELVQRDRDALDDAQDVGELELHEADVVFLGGLDLGQRVHGPELDGQWSLLRTRHPAAGQDLYVMPISRECSPPAVPVSPSGLPSSRPLSVVLH